MDAEIVRKALVAGGFLNVARRVPAPKEFSLPEFQTLIGNHKVVPSFCDNSPLVALAAAATAAAGVDCCCCLVNVLLLLM